MASRADQGPILLKWTMTIVFGSGVCVAVAHALTRSVMQGLEEAVVYGGLVAVSVSDLRIKLRRTDSSPAPIKLRGATGIYPARLKLVLTSFWMAVFGPAWFYLDLGQSVWTRWLGFYFTVLGIWGLMKLLRFSRSR